MAVRRYRIHEKTTHESNNYAYDEQQREQMNEDKGGSERGAVHAGELRQPL